MGTIPVRSGLLVAAPLAAGSGSTAARAALAARIDSLAGVPLARRQVAGLSLAVVRGRDTLVLKAYCKADLALDVPTPEQGVYEIGSVTKQFTAVAILQLAERGKLSRPAA